MQLGFDGVNGSYCLHCHEPASETARACEGCRAPFVGSGAFNRVRGPRPSPLFSELLAAAPRRAA